MGILDKLKNLFTDEEIVEETKEIEEEKRPAHELPTFMREKIEKQEAKKQIIKEEPKEDVVSDSSISDRHLVKENPNFVFPVKVDDQEKTLTRTSVNRNILMEQKRDRERKPYVESVKAPVKVEKKFRPTPIISPVYGVLDKNYSSDDLREKDNSYYEIPRDNKRINYDDVHKKAYGTLEEDLRDSILCDNCELLKTVKELKKDNTDNLIEDYINDKDDVSLEAAEENYYDYGVSYDINEIKPTKVEDRDTEMKIINSSDIEPVASKIEVREAPTRVEKNLELTDDLFNLIDSMYEEREDK